MNFRSFDLLDDRVHFCRGFFVDSLPHCKVSRIAVLRMDGDMYESTMDQLFNLYEKVQVGGVIIVDDYTIPECNRAIHDFRRWHQMDEQIRVISRQETAVYWIKRQAVKVQMDRYQPLLPSTTAKRPAWLQLSVQNNKRPGERHWQLAFDYWSQMSERKRIKVVSLHIELGGFILSTNEYVLCETRRTRCHGVSFTQKAIEIYLSLLVNLLSRFRIESDLGNRCADWFRLLTWNSIDVLELISCSSSGVTECAEITQNPLLVRLYFYRRWSNV